MPKYISLPEGLIIFTDTINNNLTHQDYARVIQIMKDYTAYLTGDGIASKLIQFTPREPADLFAQRIRLTQVTTPDIVGGCMKPMYKVGRTPAQIHFEWKDKTKNEEYKKALIQAAKNFYGETSVDEYLTYRMPELDTTDPNSFIVVEFTTEKGGFVDPKDPKTKAQPYPFEVNSCEAINYIYKNNTLQWLICKNEISLYDKNGKEVEGQKFIMYTDQNSIVGTQIHKDNVDAFVNQYNPVILTEITADTEFKPGVVYLYNTTSEKTKSQRRIFSIQVFEHKIGFVPARRVGIIRDLLTRGRTCVPLIHAAQAYLEKSIKTVSEFDITNCLHTFPQKIAYVDKCPGYTEEKDGTQHTTPCLRGVGPMGHKCKECQGSGIKIHKTAADLIGVPMPKDPKDMANLENMLVYKYPPTEILEFQKKLALYEWRYFAQKAVWNSEVFTEEDFATATKAKIDLDSVYDTLQPFAGNYSGMWKHIMKCIAILRDIGKDMEVVHDYPKDFKMKPYSELLNDYKIANENGAPSYIKKALTHDISMKLYVDQPEELVKINTKEKYFPFNGKTETEINYIIANDLTSQYAKILYANFDNIFSDIEYDISKTNTEDNRVDFYHMTEEEQRKLIEAKVSEYMAELEETDISKTAVAFQGAVDNLGIKKNIPGANNPEDNNPDGTPNLDNATA